MGEKNKKIQGEETKESETQDIAQVQAIPDQKGTVDTLNLGRDSSLVAQNLKQQDVQLKKDMLSDFASTIKNMQQEDLRFKREMLMFIKDLFPAFMQDVNTLRANLREDRKQERKEEREENDRYNQKINELNQVRSELIERT